MTALPELVAQRGIQNAVVIDDVFDATPRPDDLHAESWAVFFDDLGEAGHRLLSDFFSGYEETDADELRASPEFVAVLWQHRDELPHRRAMRFLGSMSRPTPLSEEP